MKSIIEKWRLVIGAVMLALLAWLASGRSAQAQTLVSGGNMEGNVTWTAAGSPYILQGSISINANATLTIEPGVVVRIQGPQWLDVMSGGTLIAEGTATQPITFGSNSPTPRAGDWYLLRLYSGSRARLAHCTIQHAGLAGTPSLLIASSEVQMRNCTVANGVNDGILVSGVGLTPRLQAVTVQAHGMAAIRQDTPNMQPIYRNLTLSGNGLDAVVTAGGTLDRNVTFDASTTALNGRPLVVDGSINVAAGATLTLTPGTQLRWRSGQWLNVVSGGTLIAEGTATQPITITTHSETPSPGAWYHILFEPGSQGQLSHCVIEYAGLASAAALNIRSSAVNVQNCLIHQNYSDGVQVTDATPHLRFNRINNNRFGIRNMTPDTLVDARANWWGDASGPNHPATNPAGLGNAASDGVLFDPWFTTSSPMDVLLSPDRGGDIGDVTLSIFAASNTFKPGGMLRLTRPGEDAITAALIPISVTGDVARATLNLAGKARGLWDVTLQLDNTASVVIPGGFTIEVGKRADVWVDMVGRENIAAGRRSTFILFVGNRGNVDAPGALIGLTGLPANAQIDLGSGLWKPDNSEPFDSFAATRVISNQLVSTLVITRIQPLTTIARQIVITVPNPVELDLEIVAFTTVGLPSGSDAASKNGPSAASIVPSSDDRYADADIPALSEAFEVAKAYEAPDNWYINFTGRACVGVTKDRNERLQSAALRPGSNLAGWEVAGGTTGWYGFGHTLTLLRSPHSGRAYALDTYVGGTKVIPMEPDILGGYTYKYPASDIVHSLLSSVMLDYSYKLGTLQLEFDTLGPQCPLPTVKTRSKVRVVTSRDPNAKAGLSGSGKEHYVNPAGKFSYIVMFENQPTASAPAQEVVITDQLDVAAFDLTTFELGAISFADKVLIPLPNSQSFAQDVDLRPARALIVRVRADLNPLTGLVTWSFKSVDPATGELPDDPFLGLLPPNINAPGGEGQVLFSIMPRTGLATGTVVHNRAEIIFDLNAPLVTNRWQNIIDVDAPVSQVQALPASQQTNQVTVNWAGTDVGVGIEQYSIYVAHNGGPYKLWLANTSQQTAVFKASASGSYSFHSIARDGAGNVETGKQNAEASVDVLVTGQAGKSRLYLPAILRPANSPEKSL